jgi:hypothetical protein
MKYLFFFLILCASFLSHAQDCAEVKTGEFITIDDEVGGTILKRTETSQEEIAEQLGVHMKFDLTWTSDCTYVLYNASLISGDPQYLGNKTDTLFVEITQVNMDGYNFISTANFADFEMKGTVTRK